jgi:alginate O-acetyltransferase complex protein AlgI
MLFNSYVFVFFFLPVVWGLVRISSIFGSARLSISILTVSSLFFYAYWSPPHVALIVFSMLFNFVLGKQIRKAKRCQKGLAAAAIAVNLGLIAYFKYTNFLFGIAADVFRIDVAFQEIVLPLGISFFTFQQIAYIVDCYKGKVVDHDFLRYSLFVSFFPQLIAGPIVRQAEMLPQFSKLGVERSSYKTRSEGATVFVLGLAKKVLIADSLSPIVGGVFDSSLPVGFTDAWLGALAYTLQIYFDFSGYSDMAIGLGKFFNIKIPVNFNSPYKSLSIIDFWRRWHMTLSAFLKDYLYIPLGGNRKGPRRRYANLMLTMILGGLWHGAAWNFVVWGGLHGLYLCINQLWMKIPVKLPRSFSWVLTFGSVVIAWVLFRAPSFQRAVDVFKGMFGWNGDVRKVPQAVDWDLPEKFLGIPLDERVILVALFLIISLALPSAWSFAESGKWRHTKPVAVGLGAVFVITVLFMTRISEFLYFQF